VAINAFGSHYTVSTLITNPAVSVGNLGVHCHATRPLWIIYISINPAQAALVTDAGCAVQLARKTTAAAGTAITAATFMNHDGGGSDAGFTAYHTATTQGTTGDVIADGYNSRVGFEWRPTPEEYISIPAGVANGFAIIHTVAPPTGIYAFKMTCVEVG
jgi:hypothetical protein